MIRLIRPYVTFADMEGDFRAILDSGWLTGGPHVAAFRQHLAEYTGARHAFLTTSATTALSVCGKLLDLGPGDEVVVSDFSFPATANVVEDLGARPVFADVSPSTYNMSAAALEGAITDATRAVIFVDAFGNPSGLPTIARICRQHAIPLIEDAACAIGSACQGRRCGSVADLTCFSFHPRKLLTTGEGGAVTLADDEKAAWFERRLAHGAVSRDGHLDFVDVGYNYRMSELQAAMGLRQLASLDAVVRERQATRLAYIEALAPLGFRPQHIDAGVVFNVQSVVFQVPAGLDRDALIAALRRRRVETTIGTYCLSGCTYYRQKYNTVQPVAESLEGTTISLPCYRDVDVERVCQQIRDALTTGT